MQCRYAPASSSITTHFAGFPAAPSNDSAGLEAWVDYFGDGNWSHASRGDFGCYTPLDHQCHHLACADGREVCPDDAAAAADFARFPLRTNAKNDLKAPRKSGLCTPAAHHRAGGKADAWPRPAELDGPRGAIRSQPHTGQNTGEHTHIVCQPSPSIASSEN